MGHGKTILVHTGFTATAVRRHPGMRAVQEGIITRVTTRRGQPRIDGASGSRRMGRSPSTCVAVVSRDSEVTRRVPSSCGVLGPLPRDGNVPCAL